MDDGNLEGNDEEEDGMYGVDPEFGVAQFSDEENDAQPSDNDVFFVESSKKRNDKLQKESSGEKGRGVTKEELELLIAGDDGKY